LVLKSGWLVRERSFDQEEVEEEKLTRALLNKIAGKHIVNYSERYPYNVRSAL
jgi:hypothetical protein